MRIAIDDIPEGSSTCELTFRPEEIALEVEGVSFIGSITAILKLFKQSDTIFVKAEISTVIEQECARCLLPVQSVLEGTVENHYGPLPKTKRYLLDDIGIGYYSGDYIELSEDFRESFILELPARSLCSESCKGLCLECGENLNDGECNCSSETEEIPNSKFADMVKMLELNRKLEV